MIIDDVQDKISEIATKVSRDNVLSGRSERLVPLLSAQAEKLSKADLHIHSTYSDGIPTIEQILEHTERHTNLDVIAITDHNIIDGSLRARDLWARSSYRFDFVVGEEVSTNEGHLLALFIEKHIPSHFSMERSIDLVHEQGGLAIVVHPLHPLFRMSCQREILDRIYASNDVWLDGIETWNAGFCGIYTNRITVRANRQFYGWPEVGNSDAHTLDAIGRGCTLYQGFSAADVRTAIQSGLSAPGGRLWNVNDYLKLAGYHINKRRSSYKKRAA